MFFFRHAVKKQIVSDRGGAVFIGKRPDRGENRISVRKICEVLCCLYDLFSQTIGNIRILQFHGNVLNDFYQILPCNRQEFKLIHWLNKS